MILCLLNNLFAVANMLLGASAVISFMSVAFFINWKLADDRSTGIHIIAATFLLPLGVAMYTFFGGIKAT